jgi:hypothetical protein
LKEFDSHYGELVLFNRARREYDWQTSDKWGDLLDRVHERHPVFDDKAQAIFVRWLKVYYGVPVVLGVQLLDHSGLTVYLGSGPLSCDPGGWDTSWMGFYLADPEKVTEAGTPPELVEEGLRAEFKEFSDWVSGSVYGYVVTHEDGHDIDDDSCWGFYGSETYDERRESRLSANQMIVGWRLKYPDKEVVVAQVEDNGDGSWGVDFADGSFDDIRKDSMITLVHPGHMREAFMEVVERDRQKLAADEAEIAEMRLVEVGG